MRKIAVPTKQGNIDPHLGKATEFTIFSLNDDRSFSTQTVPARGDGHISAVDLLARLQADTLICGDIGLMARNALQMMELTLIPGCTGSAQEAAEKLLRGQAQGDPSILAVEIEMDENDPMQCMHDCAKCSGCGDPEMIEKLKSHIPKI